MDESGINTKEKAQYGWAPRSKRCRALKSGGHGKRISMAAAVSMRSPYQFIAPMVFAG